MDTSAPLELQSDQPAAQGNRSGTIEATPVPREAIGFIAAKKFHAVDDKELDGLARLEKPAALAFAALFGGVFMGSALSASDIFLRISTGGGVSGRSETILLTVCAVSFGIALASAIASTRSRSKLTGVIGKIRKRSKIYLPAGHPLVPETGK